MSINMLSIHIIRMNLNFRVALTLFIDSSLFDNIMDSSRKRGEGVFLY